MCDRFVGYIRDLIIGNIYTCNGGIWLVGDNVSDRRGGIIIETESPSSRSASDVANPGSEFSIPSAVPERAPACGTMSMGD